MFATIFNILGSLGLFLFGMKMMSDGLQKVSGEKLRSVMRTMTGNRFKGIISGTLITTAVQSSSLTTVMVVSFVNAGLLTLKEAIGVIMGANLGTTTTAWVIALIGFKVSLSNIALPVVGVGVVLSFFKKPQVRDFGEFLVGFGLLFMGLDLLKNAVPDMQGHPEWLEWVNNVSDMGYVSVLLFLGIGVVLTLIVQASSVTMAITITMAAKGWITFDLAAAIVLGENIGTTITANLAALQASWNAKRAAIAHLIFNVLGCVWALIFFYWFTDLICWLIPAPQSVPPDMLPNFGVEKTAVLTAAQHADIMQRAAVPERLALFHTLFNLFNIFILVSFVSQIEKIACWILKDSPDRKHRTSEQKLEYLAGNIADLGELAIVEGQKELLKLSQISGEMFNGFVHIVKNPDKDLSAEVNHLRELEDESDKLAIALTNFFVQCSSQKLAQETLKQVSRDMMVIPELEAICDACYRLITFARKRYRRQLSDSILRSSAFIQLCEEMSKFIKLANKAIERGEPLNAAVEGFSTTRESLSLVRKSLRKEAIAQMESGGVTQGGILFIEMLSACGRVNAHALNVLEAMSMK